MLFLVIPLEKNCASIYWNHTTGFALLNLGGWMLMCFIFWFSKLLVDMAGVCMYVLSA